MKKDKHIFIIEENLIAGLELRRQLEDNGYTVFQPLSLVDTEVIIGLDTSDIIIADSYIQRQDNLERVKKYFGRHELPIICIGTVANEAMNECEGINIIGTFSIPFDSKDILALVNKHFDSTN